MRAEHIATVLGFLGLAVGVPGFAVWYWSDREGGE